MSEQKSGRGSWFSRWGGLRRRRRRRGPMARAPHLGRPVAEEPREEEAAAHGPALGFPVRARPAKIEFIEEYHYKIKVERNAIHDPQPAKTLGEIQIMLPCDKMGREALADAMRHTARHAGDLPVRYGWLALAHIGKSDLAERLSQVRAWDKPPYQAFPLRFPLLGEGTERLEDQIEAGALGWEQLFYRPDPPLPFPVEFHLFMARDAAVPSEPLPPGASEGYRLPAPNAASGLEWALHVRFSVNLRRPKEVTEENCKISLGRLHINWPVPVVAEQLEWHGPPEARFFVDERYKQVVVEGVPLRMTSEGKGPLRGEISFRIGVRQPATLLRGDRFFKGRFRLDASNIALSRVRALYFDAAGYLQQLNCDDKPLLSYRTEVHGDFEYVLRRQAAGGGAAAVGATLQLAPHRAGAQTLCGGRAGAARARL